MASFHESRRRVMATKEQSQSLSVIPLEQKYTRLTESHKQLHEYEADEKPIDGTEKRQRQ